MTNQNMFNAATPQSTGGIPHGEVLGNFDSNDQAQALVNRLAKAEFPVKAVAIIGSDLKSIEKVTGKITYARAAMSGGASGIWLGMLFGLVTIIFSPDGAISPSFIMSALLIGAGFGALFAVVMYYINRKRRGFTSMTKVVASSYAVIVAPELFEQAKAALLKEPTA